LSGLIELGRLARPDAVASVTAVYYALAYLGLTTPYLLTLASPQASYRTLLLILAAMALTSAGVVASAGWAPAPAALDDRDPGAHPDTSGAAQRRPVVAVERDRRAARTCG
jgi:hypothetical protein